MLDWTLHDVEPQGQGRTVHPQNSTPGYTTPSPAAPPQKHPRKTRNWSTSSPWQNDSTRVFHGTRAHIRPRVGRAGPAVPSWTSLSLGPPTGAEPLATMTRLGSARPSSHSSGSPATTLLPRKAVSQHKRQLAHHPEPPAYLVLGVRRPCPRDVPVKFCFGHLEALRGYHCDDEEGERGLRRVGQGGWKWRKKGAGRVGCG